MTTLLKKRLILTASTGRCGTKYLAQQLDKLSGVCGRWEDQPNFAYRVRFSQSDPEIARFFWLNSKLPTIQKLDCGVYISTSHYAIQGFFDPLLELDIVPDLILLYRDDRETALSFWRRKSIPLSKVDKVWPSDPNLKCPIDYEGLTDYQLVYWWIKELRIRQITYRDIVLCRGGKAVEAHLRDVVTYKGFTALTTALGLPTLLRKKFSGEKVNASKPEWQSKMPPGDIDELEEEVCMRILSYTQPT